MGEDRINRMLEASVQQVIANRADVREQAAMCALARGDTTLFETAGAVCPCGVIQTTLLWFGPTTRWLCSICMKPGQHVDPGGNEPDA